MVKRNDMGRMIGIVGGMGTYAGIDLLTKIADNTGAVKDQEHLPVIMISEPELVMDRSEYLLGHISENPGFAIAEIAVRLAKAGASHIAIPCNTAHVPEILKPVIEKLPGNCILVNMIEEVGKYISREYPKVSKPGLLATNGTYETGVYTYYLAKSGIEVIYPDRDSQYKKVHPSIYDPGYGIKAQSNPVSNRSINDLHEVAESLIDSGAELIILGCTEIPLALAGDSISGVPLVDASDVLAKALVREYRISNKDL
jgi:aspartate racemase